jgi:anti-anti-sigma factor
MWSYLRLRTRILLSYAAILVLVFALALYLVAQIDSLVQSGRRLNSEVRSNVASSSLLLIGITDVQQAVGAYVVQPTPINQAAARTALAALNQKTTTVRQSVVSAMGRTQIRELNATFSGYEQDFGALVSLLERQVRTEQVLRDELGAADRALDTAFQQSPPDATHAPQIRRSLQHAIDYSTEAVRARNIDQLTLALAALRSVTTQVDVLEREMPVSAISSITSLRTAITQAKLDLSNYTADTILRRNYEQRMRERDTSMRALATALAGQSVEMLENNSVTLGDEGARAQQLGYGALGLTLVLAALGGLWLARTITRPLMSVVEAIQRINQGDYATVVTSSDRSEVGQLALAFNQMAAALAHEHDQVEKQQRALSERNRELERAFVEIQSANQARDAMRTTIVNLSVPVLPILSDVIHVPLVGEIDQERASILIERVLRGVETYRARQVILDVTGVPLIDSQVAQWLIHVIDAARLLGATSVLVGVAPEVAQALVTSGIDMSSVRVQSDLRSAVAMASRSAAT